MPPEKIEQLEKLNKSTNTLLIREAFKSEFLKLFKTVMDAVVKAERRMSERMENQTTKSVKNLRALEGEHKEALVRIEEENKNNISGLRAFALRQISNLFIKVKINERVKAITDEHNSRMGLLDSTMTRLQERADSIIDGKTPTVDELVALIMPLIPDPLLNTSEDIRDKLELLEGEERLHIRHIDGLEEFLKGKKFGAKTIMTGQNPGSMVVLTVTGAKNDSNVTFTISQKPILLNINGAFYREDNGWSWGANDTITIDGPVGSGGDIYGIL